MDRRGDARHRLGQLSLDAFPILAHSNFPICIGNEATPAYRPLKNKVGRVVKDQITPREFPILISPGRRPGRIMRLPPHSQNLSYASAPLSAGAGPTASRLSKVRCGPSDVIGAPGSGGYYLGRP